MAPRDTCQDLKGEQSPLLPLETTHLILCRPCLICRQWDTIVQTQDKDLFLLQWPIRSQVSLPLSYNPLCMVLHIQGLLQPLPQQPLIPWPIRHFLGHHLLSWNLQSRYVYPGHCPPHVV